MYHEYRGGPIVSTIQRKGWLRPGWREGERVSDRAELPFDEVVKLVAPVRCGCEAQPSAGTNLLDGIVEGGRGKMMTFVYHHEAVTIRDGFQVSRPRQGLQHGDVDDAVSLSPSAAELAGFDPEKVGDSAPPLLGKRPSVDEDECRDTVRGNRGAGDDRLAGAWWCDQYAEVVSPKGGEGELLRVG